MSNQRILNTCGVVTAAAVLAMTAADPGWAQSAARLLTFPNATGFSRTISMTEFDREGPFFQQLGTNGRSCATCHQAADGWSIAPRSVQRRFRASAGADPIFRNNDGSNCEGVLTSSLDEQQDAYSLLLTRGLIRVGLDVPANAEFTVDAVRDPYGCSASSGVSAYRRPLPSTNLRFLSAVMWDGRESLPGTTIEQDLLRQANHATRGHAEAFADITRAQARAILDFEMGLFTAQSRDSAAGNLNAGARGGPRGLPAERFFIGINDPFGLNPIGARFDVNAFTLFGAWSARSRSVSRAVVEARRSIARGEAIFNTRPMDLAGIAGLNGARVGNGPRVPASFTGTCTVCHDSPNVGNRSVQPALDIGVSRPFLAPYLPVYTLRRTSSSETIETTDPGRAMITGRWSDVNKFKVPILRGLAARPPYFHNGFAETLERVVEFYDRRFRIGLTPQEKADLAAFLRAL